MTVLLVAVLTYLAGAATVVWLDARRQSKHRNMLDTRAWAEKVAAMRRMTEEDRDV
jgi:hypothetical protein